MLAPQQPLSPEIGLYMSHQLVSELPQARVHAILAVTKMLHFLKLRTLSEGSREKVDDRLLIGDCDTYAFWAQLLLQQTRNPLKRTITLTQPLADDFTERFIEAFKQPLTADGT